MAEEVTTAEIGYGAVIDLSTDDGSTWDSGGQVAGDITPPSATVDVIEASHMQSPGRIKEYITGMSDPGECSYPIHFNAGSAIDDRYLAIRAAGERVKVRITFGNAAIWTFDALLTGYAPQVPINDRQTAQVTWKVTGSTVVT
jgi:hypothetical protein